MEVGPADLTKGCSYLSLLGEETECSVSLNRGGGRDSRQIDNPLMQFLSENNKEDVPVASARGDGSISLETMVKEKDNEQSKNVASSMGEREHLVGQDDGVGEARFKKLRGGDFERKVAGWKKSMSMRNRGTTFHTSSRGGGGGGGKGGRISASSREEKG